MASAEQKKSYQTIKDFKGLDTKANRTAIKEDEFSWIENAMPIGAGNMKIIPTYTSLGVTFSNTVNYLFSANINLVDYLIAFESDGSAQYVNLLDNTIHTLAAAGTFSGVSMNISQWKSERVLIIDPTKGYFTWDGTNLIFIGSVGLIGITNSGTGYTTVPTVQISAPNNANGVNALATAVVSSGSITSIVLTEAGTGYTSAPTVTITGGGGTNATAIAGIITFATGTVSVTVTNGGSGYTNAANTTVTIAGGGGANAAAKAILAGGQVTQVIMTNPGSGYTNASNITVTIAGGGGSNATATGIINLQPNVGISSFSGQVWIAAGRTVFYSAPGSYSNFVAASAGNITITDSTLHSNIIQIMAANNFLYIFGDDSINVFSDVRVSNVGTTLFTNTNVSASIGSKLPYAIFPYFRSVLFMNNYGVYALVGSTTSKISDSLDGMFPFIDFTLVSSSGQVLLNGILCSVFNFKYTGTQGGATTPRYIQAVFFDKKWFITSQGDNLKFITSAPLGGKINMYGTDGTSCVQLYSDSTSNVSSYIQTALSPMGDAIRTKQALKFGVEATLTNGGIFNVTVDSEYGSSPSYSLTNSVYWTNNVGNTIAWTNNSSTVISWIYATGYALYKSDAMQWGKYLGLTMTSQSPNFTVNTYEFEHELRVRF